MLISYLIFLQIFETKTVYAQSNEERRKEGSPVFRKKRAGSWTDETFLAALYAEEHYIYRMSFLYLKQEQEALENVQEVAFRAWKYRKSRILKRG